MDPDRPPIGLAVRTLLGDAGSTVVGAVLGHAADVVQTLYLVAHGFRRLDVILSEDDPAVPSA